MPSTNFDVTKYGFHFDNSKVRWQIHAGGPGGKNLCGGMVYGALDAFLAQRPTPPMIPPPAAPEPEPGSELNEYLYWRQFRAHIHTVPRLGAGTPFLGLLDPDKWFVDSVASEYYKIVKWVSAGCPAPLFLVKEQAFHGHHVLVTSCQATSSMVNPILTVYDPNYPDVETYIKVDHRRKRFDISRSSLDWEVKGFFFDPGYHRQQPPW